MKAGTWLQAFIKDQMFACTCAYSSKRSAVPLSKYLCLGPPSRFLPLHNKSPNQVLLVLQLFFFTSVLAILDILHYCVNLAIRSSFPIKSLLGFWQVKLGRTHIWRQSWPHGCGKSLFAVKPVTSLQCFTVLCEGCTPLARYILNRFIVFWRCCKGNCRFLSWVFVAAEVRNPRITPVVSKGCRRSCPLGVQPWGLRWERSEGRRKRTLLCHDFFFISTSNCLLFVLSSMVSPRA